MLNDDDDHLTRLFFAFDKEIRTEIRRNEYRSKGGDALRLGVKADMVLFAGNTV